MQVENNQTAQQQQLSEERELAAEMEEESQSESWTKYLTEISEKAASYALGQYVIKKMDRLLWIVEKTTKWSLPSNLRESPSRGDGGGADADDDDDVPEDSREYRDRIPTPPLIRPLPWLLFIPLLIALRFVRIGLSFGALMLGKTPMTPYDIISFIQIQRRRLRAIRFVGLRNIRLRNIKEAELRKSGKIAKKTILSRLSDIFALLMCNRDTTVSPVEVIVGQTANGGAGDEEKKVVNGKKSRKRQLDNSGQEEQLCDEMLDLLANECESDDDSSFKYSADSLCTSDVTISDDESETDNILNKTMNEKDILKYGTPKSRKSRSQPNSSQKVCSTPKRNITLPIEETNPSQDQNRNDEPEALPIDDATVASPEKQNGTENGHTNNGTTEPGLKNGTETNTNETEQAKNGSSKENETSEASGESVNALPESQRPEGTETTSDL